ncbi:MAG: DUF1571 domain-containing protein [Planctomycetota bacterium]|nr:DUF1571 domain-containing protein [Planctomycetota bacterium]
MQNFSRRKLLAQGSLIGGTLLFSPILFGQEGPSDRIATKERSGFQPRVAPPHALDPALKMAYASLTNIRSSIKDYQAIVVKRERVNGVLGDYEYMGAKIRNRQVDAGQVKVPFSVYLTFLGPDEVKGREVIYVENENKGNLIAHEGGMTGRFLPTVTLDPTGILAMKGQRYPITEMGIENLVVKLIEKGERDKKAGPCEVQFSRGAKVAKRDCTVLTVRHRDRKPCYDFCEAQIFIDNELNIPIRYAAYDWPKTVGGKKELLEEYTYMNVKTNVGLTDKDFDQKNPKYRF